MLTLTDAPARVRLSEPVYRPFEVTVARIRRLGPSFLRFTFTGDDLEHFGTECLDQRIKVVVPVDGMPMCDLFGADGGADWYATWRALPDAERNPLRTYTARAVRPELREVDVDFVCHGDTGPATRWATTAQPGDSLLLVGPNALCDTSAGVGIEWRPGDARTLLLAGDETAVPAISGILGSLDDSATGHVFLEVPYADDIQHVTAPAGVTVTWLPRNDLPHGERLTEAVRHWAAGHPPLHGAFGLYAWLAGEAGTVKALRRFLVREAGVDRSQVAFMGYWRAGRPEN
ncbi:siderophore-interacting protein [Planctomonas deserti]|uniref:siderophore-interacting protein n=1 Tax=Planctomonas deserti TaxID=2144185 RepID=UPI000D3AFE9E|nr:siderophore-interacting protein [Planctomonas deserti]